MRHSECVFPSIDSTSAILTILHYITEVLARSTSVREALDLLKPGTDLWKVRYKGMRGFRGYKRKYKLDLPELALKYTPNRGAGKNIAASNCMKPGNILQLSLRFNTKYHNSESYHCNNCCIFDCLLSCLITELMLFARC